MRFFEDIEIGATQELGVHEFTADEIVSFAVQWDPHPFHVDAEAAKASHFGGLCASGWHTACAWMRLNVAWHARQTASETGSGRAVPVGVSPGFSNLSWKLPVYAGDRIAFRNTLAHKRPLASRPGWGLVTVRAEGFKEDGDLAFAFDGKVMMPRRPAG